MPDDELTRLRRFAGWVAAGTALRMSRRDYCDLASVRRMRELGLVTLDFRPLYTENGEPIDGE
jgi:hypothetical protein